MIIDRVTMQAQNAAYQIQLNIMDFTEALLSYMYAI